MRRLEAAGALELVAGKHYRCSQDSIVAQVYSAASRAEVNVLVLRHADHIEVRYVHLANGHRVMKGKA